MKNHHSTYQDRVARIVESDSITTDNLTALFQSNPAQPVALNVHDWLIKSALRRHRKASFEAHAPLNNAMGLALKAIKARAGK